MLSDVVAKRLVWGGVAGGLFWALEIAWICWGLVIADIALELPAHIRRRRAQ